jgi:uncharacterized protein DUF6069
MTASILTTNGIVPIRQPVTEKILLATCRIRGGRFVEWAGTGRTRRPLREEHDMSTTQIPTQHSTQQATEAPAPAAERLPVWKHGLAAAVVAAAATSLGAAIASAAGVSFSNGTDPSIPIAGFAQLTLVFSLIGVGIAAVVARKARRPRSTFVRTAVVLTVLSFVPDLTFGFEASSAAALITLHTIAALIVVPTLARRLNRSR